MTVLIRNVRIIDPTACIDVVDDVAISPGMIGISPRGPRVVRVIDGRGKIFCPGFIDLHVHFREPGFLYKSDIATGIRAALSGGVTSALVMPNTAPVIDSVKHVVYQQQRGARFGFDLMVAAAASRTLSGLHETDIASLARAGVKAVTDDGRPVLDNTLMEKLLRLCRRHDLVFMQHAEDCSISHGHVIHEGRASAALGIPGQPSSSESRLIERDVALGEKIGARYHVLHLSTKEGLAVVRRAKRRGLPVSCEVAPHHLLLTDSAVLSRDANYKMNPPLRGKEDVEALIEGLCDNSIDAVASDHAPHSRREKRAGLMDAPFGVVGVQTLMLALLTLVKTRGLPLARAISLLTSGPARVLRDDNRIGTFKNNSSAVLIDPNARRIFCHRHVVGDAKNSPFIGMELFGKIELTFLHGYPALEY